MTSLGDRANRADFHFRFPTSAIKALIAIHFRLDHRSARDHAKLPATLPAGSIDNLAGLVIPHKARPAATIVLVMQHKLESGLARG